MVGVNSVDVGIYGLWVLCVKTVAFLYIIIGEGEVRIRKYEFLFYFLCLELTTVIVRGLYCTSIRSEGRVEISQSRVLTYQQHLSITESKTVLASNFLILVTLNFGKVKLYS